MKIAMLAVNPNLYSHKRLVEAAETRGHTLEILNTKRIVMSINANDPAVYLDGEKLPKFDAVIPRIGASITFYGLAVLRQFEVMGVFPLNESVAIGRSRDKLRSLQLLARRGIGLPVTMFANDAKHVDQIVEAVGGAPVVIKLLEGTQGVGVVLAETLNSAKSVIEAFSGAKVNILVQEFIKEAGGSDLRCFVIDDKVIATMKRQGAEGDFRSNLHRGGKATSVRITPQERLAAVGAAKAMGLNVCGVDMLRSNHGPVIMEINSSPGLEGIETATGVNVAGAIIEEMERKVLFPEVDYRQRLTVSAGYGIAEFTVVNMPSLEGRQLRETDLMRRRIQVINIIRNKVPIPIPEGDTVIETGDKLICYGDLLEMRGMMEEENRNRRERRKLKKRKKGALSKTTNE